MMDIWQRPKTPIAAHGKVHEYIRTPGSNQATEESVRWLLEVHGSMLFLELRYNVVSRQRRLALNSKQVAEFGDREGSVEFQIGPVNFHLVFTKCETAGFGYNYNLYVNGTLSTDLVQVLPSPVTATAPGGMLFGHSPRDDSLLTRGKLWADDFDQHIASANALDEQGDAPTLSEVFGDAVCAAQEGGVRLGGAHAETTRRHHKRALSSRGSQEMANKEMARGLSSCHVAPTGSSAFSTVASTVSGHSAHAASVGHASATTTSMLVHGYNNHHHQGPRLNVVEHHPATLLANNHGGDYSKVWGADPVLKSLPTGLCPSLLPGPPSSADTCSLMSFALDPPSCASVSRTGHMSRGPFACLSLDLHDTHNVSVCFDSEDEDDDGPTDGPRGGSEAFHFAFEHDHHHHVPGQGLPTIRSDEEMDDFFCLSAPLPPPAPRGSSFRRLPGHGFGAAAKEEAQGQEENGDKLGPSTSTSSLCTSDFIKRGLTIDVGHRPAHCPELSWPSLKPR